MSEGSFKLATPDWVLPVAVILLLALVVLMLSYRHRLLPTWMKVTGVTLKFVAIAALAFCLLQPTYQGQRPRPKANLLPIVVDESESMLVGVGEREANAAALSKSLRDDQGWRVRLEQDFDVRPYAFAANLRSVRDLSQLEYRGTTSALGTSLDTLSARFESRPMAGILLFTDGNVTDTDDFVKDWSQLSVPVYPVLQDRPALRDLRITSATVSQSDFEAAPVTIDVRLESDRLSGRKTVVEVLDSSSKSIEQQVINAPADGQGTDVRFRFRPDRSGIQFYTIATYVQSEAESFTAGTSSAEATLANNRQIVTVDRPRGPFRILYVAGRPNWEFKFLRRSLAEDAEIELTGLLRIAKRQPKFSFRDSSLPSTNPLFAGLGDAEEEAAEEHDEPVILRLGVDQAEDLKTGFPSEPEELFVYDAVILDDIEAEFFSTDQQLLLRRFVAVRGGGLMTLGGQESFDKGGYSQTPIGEMVPVYLRSERVAEPAAADEPASYRFQLTREGMLQPWLRLRSTESEEQQRLGRAVPLQVLNRASDVKPGAEILATVTDAMDSQRSYPAVVTQRFGNGRASAVLVGDLWRWFMRTDSNPAADQAGDASQAWRQWVRWLVSDVPQAIEIEVQDAASSTAPLAIEVRVRDEVFLPLDNASVELLVTNPDGSETPLRAAQDEQQAGLYSVSYWSPQSGGFFVKARVQREDGSSVGEAEAGWSADPSAAEFRELSINEKLLREIADATGGEVLQQRDLAGFASSLSAKKMPVMETWAYPIWHRPWMLLLAIACLCTEWGLRRWKGWP